MSPLLLLPLLLVLPGALSRIESLHISSDARLLYDIDSFGFQTGGERNVRLTNLQIELPPDDPASSQPAPGAVSSPRVGFVIVKVR